MTTAFGDDSWRGKLQPHESFDTLCRQVLELYKAKLRAIPGVGYVFAFEMRGAKDTLNYHLVFASRNPQGLRKMKEAMRKIDQSGSYCFSDGRVGQDVLFRFDAPADFIGVFHQTFLGREVTYREMDDFALNETPFINPRSMLKLLEDEGALVVKSSNPKRKRGDFNEDTLVSVTFLPRKVKVEQMDLFNGKT